MIAYDNFDLILRRHQEIPARLADGASGAQYSALSRELSELEPVVKAIQSFLAKEKERADLMALLREPDLDPAMRAMASDELAVAEAEADAMSRAIRIALLPKDAADEGSAIIAVRAETKQPCSPATCSGCTSNTPSGSAGRSRSCRPARERQGDSRKSSPKSQA